MRMTATLMLALLTVACGQPAQQQPANQVAPAVIGQRIAALAEGERNAVFIRAIRDAGMDCQQVTGSAPAALYRGMPVWTATCRGGGRWTLVVGPNEVVQILNASEAQLVRSQPGNGQ